MLQKLFDFKLLYPRSVSNIVALTKARLKQSFPKVATGFGIKTLLKQKNLSRHSLAEPAVSA
jgi:hypothetical protein